MQANCALKSGKKCNFRRDVSKKLAISAFLLHYTAQRARKFKKVLAKKLVKLEINQFHEKKNFFDQIPFFAISKMAKKSNCEKV